LPGFDATPDPVIGKNVVPVGLPYRLGAGFRKEANPDKDVIAIGTKRMAGANAVEREVTEETIQIRIVKCPVPEDHRNMGVEAVR
jgi:hypothetical protein